MRFSALILLFFISISCKTLKLEITDNQYLINGHLYYNQVQGKDLNERENMAVEAILGGSIPEFLTKFHPIKTSMYDSVSGKQLKALYYVSPDYLAVGDNEDWARIPLSPMAGQQLADSLDCFLPTRKMVDEIYKQATVKLEPVPMYAFRDSVITFWQHHLIIEGQRKGRKGIVAGIKKDVVISGALLKDSRPNRVAIYGWHKPDGIAIQPLYTGHVNWYVDYSHGIRLVWRQVKILLPEKNRWLWMDYEAVLSNPRLRGLLCDEVDCSFTRY